MGVGVYRSRRSIGGGGVGEWAKASSRHALASLTRRPSTLMAVLIVSEPRVAHRRCCFAVTAQSLILDERVRCVSPSLSLSLSHCFSRCSCVAPPPPPSATYIILCFFCPIRSYIHNNFLHRHLKQSIVSVRAVFIYCLPSVYIYISERCVCVCKRVYGCV